MDDSWEQWERTEKKEEVFSILTKHSQRHTVLLDQERFYQSLRCKFSNAFLEGEPWYIGKSWIDWYDNKNKSTFKNIWFYWSFLKYLNY